MRHIQNKKLENAFIVESFINPVIHLTFKELQEKKEQFNEIRVYFWLDNDPITEHEIKIFECLFETQGLNPKRILDGHLFDIDNIDCKNFDFSIEKLNSPSTRTPRRAGDGGVIR